MATRARVTTEDDIRTLVDGKTVVLPIAGNESNTLNKLKSLLRTWLCTVLGRDTWELYRVNIWSAIAHLFSIITLLPATSNPSVLAPAGLPPLCEFGLSPCAIREDGTWERLTAYNKRDLTVINGQASQGYRSRIGNSKCTPRWIDHFDILKILPA